MANKLKILHYDIETAPMLTYVWRPKTEWVNKEMSIRDVHLISWAARWDGMKAQPVSDWLTPGEVHRGLDDVRIANSLADLIREADIVVAHNGDRFDLPKVNGRVAIAGAEPLGPVDTIDTLKLSRASFGFAYHNLDYLAEIFLDEHKIKTDWSWWEDIMNGSEAAMKKMVKYGRKDVVLLERVFHAMIPYVKTLRRLYDTDPMEGIITCSYCGGHKFEQRGKKRTKVMTYMQYKCLNTKCGRYRKGDIVIRERATGL